MTGSRRTGSSTKIPHSPYTTLGIAARRSTRKPIGCRSARGASSERNIDTPSARGTAMSSATNDVASVPKIAGAAPNSPVTGFHTLEVKKSRPATRSAGHPAESSCHPTSASRNGMLSAKQVIAPRYAASPSERSPISADAPGFRAANRAATAGAASSW